MLITNRDRYVLPFSETEHSCVGGLPSNHQHEENRLEKGFLLRVSSEQSHGKRSCVYKS